MLWSSILRANHLNAKKYKQVIFFGCNLKGFEDIFLVSDVVGRRRRVASEAGPIGVDVFPGFRQQLVGVGPEVVALGLDQVCRQTSWPEANKSDWEFKVGRIKSETSRTIIKMQDVVDTFSHLLVASILTKLSFRVLPTCEKPSQRLKVLFQVSQVFAGTPPEVFGRTCNRRRKPAQWRSRASGHRHGLLRPPRPSKIPGAKSKQLGLIEKLDQESCSNSCRPQLRVKHQKQIQGWMTSSTLTGCYKKSS